MIDLIKLTHKNNLQIKILCETIKTIWMEYYLDLHGQKLVDYICYFIKPQPIKDEIKDGANYYLIYKNEKPIGFFCFYIRNEFLYLRRIYILKSERNKKTGTFVLNKIIKIAKENNASKIQVHADINAKETNLIFQKWNFTKREKVYKCIGNGYFLKHYKLILDL